MASTNYTGVYKTNEGYWAYRYSIVVNGQRKDVKKPKMQMGSASSRRKRRQRHGQRRYQTKHCLFHLLFHAKLWVMSIWNTVRRGAPEKPIRPFASRTAYGAIICAVVSEADT